MTDPEHGTSGGVELTDELIERLATEAEEGYEVGQLRPRSRRGRPPIGSEAATPFQVRLEPELRESLARVARREHASPSETARRALRKYLDEESAHNVNAKHPSRLRTSQQGRSNRAGRRGSSAIPKVGLADQQLLLRWADSIGARSEFPRLVRRIILETGKGIIRLGFPAGEGIAAGSWDGSVRATEATAFIPKGLSHWELSVEKSVGAKANADYRKRSTTTDGSPAGTSSYVAVSLRRWRDRNTWARDRTAERRWAEVRAYGLDDIETWLETAPVTHAWISEELGLGPYGLRAAESWWESWAASTTPNMTAPLVLAGRSAFMDALQKCLEGPPQLTTIKARSVEDVLGAIAAFGVQAAANGDPGTLARTAFVDDVQTWRALTAHPTGLLLVAVTDDVIAEANIASAHHIIVPTTVGFDADIELPEIDSNEAAAALKAMGVETDRRADELGHLARRSLVALRRNIANKPELHTPAWARPPLRRELRAALLAGRWQEGSDGDRSVLTALSGMAYEQLREALTVLADREDPFVASVGQSWALVSPFDAWGLLGSHLYDDDLKRLERVAGDVLGEPDPALDLPEDERWRAPLEGRTHPYSSDLRRGLTEALAFLGVLGEKVDTGTATGETWASYLVRNLLRKANGDTTCRVWTSIADLLPLLAEAAPDVFLDGLRQGLAGEDPLLADFFTDREGEGALGGHPPHTGLLWALEAMAWADQYFGHALDMLARLAEVDPGGRFGNRPIESMATIYWPLRPQTSADTNRRLSVLDALRRRHRVVAWQLMLAIIPEFPSIQMPTQEPHFRDWKHLGRPTTIAEFARFVAETVSRLVDDAATVDDWIALVGKLPHLPPAGRELVRQTLASRLDDGLVLAADTPKLWEAVRSLTARQREYADTDRAIPKEEMEFLDALEARLRPARPSIRSGWLFADFTPTLEGHRAVDDIHLYDVELARCRREAMEEILRSGGLGDALLLAKSSPVPWAVGVAIADSTTDEYEGELLALLSAEDAAEVTVAQAYVCRRFGRDGWGWAERLARRDSDLDTRQRARLLVATRDYPRAWEVAEELGEPVDVEFWKHFTPYGLGTDFPYSRLAASRLVGVGRFAAALQLLRLYVKRDASEESADLVAQTLESVLSHGTADLEAGGLRKADFEALFVLLDQHVDRLGWERVARLQWVFLPALGVEPRVEALHSLLASDPSFFVSVLSSVYRPRGASGRGGESPEAVRMATNGYRLLSSWTGLPGLREDGTVNGQSLRGWIEEALRRLDAANRREVGETHIGQILAHAPADSDGQWPVAAVREIIEDLQSERIESGIVAGVINMRGLTSRSLDEGGAQERELAAKYRSQADRFADGWPRTAAILRMIARTYDSHARREDDEAERFRSGHAQ